MSHFKAKMHDTRFLVIMLQSNAMPESNCYKTNSKRIHEHSNYSVTDSKTISATWTMPNFHGNDQVSCFSTINKLLITTHCTQQLAVLNTYSHWVQLSLVELNAKKPHSVNNYVQSWQVEAQYLRTSWNWTRLQADNSGRLSPNCTANPAKHQTGCCTVRRTIPAQKVTRFS